ncbi:MAG: radical SAM protein [Bacteroidetes bacterium]|nr:radical SAM protein [Bacteroidota bacterium]
MRYALLMLGKFFRFKDIFFYLKKIIDFIFYKYLSIAPPIKLQIELASFCNLKCSFCVLSEIKREKKLMPLDDFKKIIDESGARYIQLSGVGETFLHPDCIEMLKYAKSKTQFVKVTTNGLVITEEMAKGIVDSGLDMLDVSIDTTDENLYKEIRGAKLEKVLGNIKTVFNYRNQKKSNLKIRAKNVYNEKNIYNLPKDIEKLDSLPFDEALFLWIADLYEGSTHSTVKKEYIGVLNEAIDVAKKIRRPDLVKNVKILIDIVWTKSVPVEKRVCYEPLYAPYITVDGDLIPCCTSAMWVLQNEKNMLQMTMGNVIKNHFMEVWKSVHAINVRKKVLAERQNFALCKDCLFDENYFLKFVYKIAKQIN